MTRDANVQGYLLTKSDRLCRSIDALTENYLRDNRTVTKKDVRLLTKAIKIAIGQELTYQGYQKEVKPCK